MQNSISYPTLSQVSTRCRPLPLPSGTCTVLEDGNSPENGAIVAFGILNNNCAAAATAVNQNQFGPYAGNGSCGYGCSYEQYWNWSGDYRNYANAQLLNGLAFMNWGSSYTTAYQPTQTWLATDLPNFGSALLADINAADFGSANTVLQNNINEANQALQSITSFLGNASPYVGYLQTLATNLQAGIVSSATTAQNNLIGQIHCGAGDVQNSFNGMFADVAVKFINLQIPLNTVNSNFQSALQSVDLVAGVFISLQSKNQQVSQFLGRAASFPAGSPTRVMYQNAAISEWNAFVSEANSQLGG